MQTDDVTYEELKSLKGDRAIIFALVVARTTCSLWPYPEGAHALLPSSDPEEWGSDEFAEAYAGLAYAISVLEALGHGTRPATVLFLAVKAGYYPKAAADYALATIGAAVTTELVSAPPAESVSTSLAVLRARYRDIYNEVVQKVQHGG